MKKNTKISLVASFIVLVALAACKKYEEGPALSLRSKKARVAGTWTIEKATANGTDVTALYAAAAQKWVMEKDGKYTRSGSFLSVPYSVTGTWEFISDKEEIRMLDDAAGSTADTLVILKLKNKEFWYKPKTDSDKEEFHLKGE